MQRTVITASPKTNAGVLLTGNGVSSGTTDKSFLFGSQDGSPTECQALQKIELQKNRIDALRKENSDLEQLLESRLQTIQQLQEEHANSAAIKEKNELLKQKLHKTTEHLNQARQESEALRKKLQAQQIIQMPENLQEKQSGSEQLQVLRAQLLANRDLIAKTQCCLLNQLQQYRKTLQESNIKQTETLSSELATLRATSGFERDSSRSGLNTMQSSDLMKSNRNNCQNCHNLNMEIAMLKEKEITLSKHIQSLKETHDMEINIQKRKARALYSQIDSMRTEMEDKNHLQLKQYNDLRRQRMKEQMIQDTKLREFDQMRLEITSLKTELEKKFQNNTDTDLVQKMFFELESLRSQNQSLRKNESSSIWDDSLYRRWQLSQLRKQQASKLAQMLSDTRMQSLPNFYNRRSESSLRYDRYM